MKLTDREWKSFKIGDIFKVTGTITTKPNELMDNGVVPRVTCASVNNGYDDFYSNNATESGAVLTVDSATVGTVLYQPFKFIATDHVEKISFPNGSISPSLGVFLRIAIVCSCDSKYQYGHKFSQQRIKRQLVMLPVNDSGEPDYQFMENYVRVLIEKKRKQYMRYAEKQLAKLDKSFGNFEGYNKSILTDCVWKPFSIEQVLSVLPGKRLEKRNIIAGNRPFISASDSNNGITAFCQNINNSIDYNVLGINYNGSVCEAFYHPYECVFSDDVKRLHLKNNKDNKYVLLSLAVIVKQQKEKYQYGYKFNEQRMKRQLIMLPVNKNGEIDYEQMENIGKIIMTTKYKKYLSYLQNQ